MSRLITWLIAILVVVLVGSSYLLDGPSETDAARATALSLGDAITTAKLSARK